MNFKTLTSYLACPHCQHQKLIFQKKSFFCPHCQQNYPIKHGIPIFLPSKKDSQEKNQIRIFNQHYQKPKKPTLWQQSMLKRIFHQTFIKNTKNYLDIGCGSSAYTIKHAQRLHLSAIGTDISFEAVLKAKKNTPPSSKTAFIVASAQSLPFKKNSFDYVSCISVLEHLKNHQQAIKIIAQILKPTGHLFLVLPNHYQQLPFFLRPIKLYFDQKIGHLRTYSVNSIKKICQKNNLNLGHYFYNGHLLKIFQIILQKLNFIPQKLWWSIEKNDINKNPHGAQINLIFQKK